MSDRFVRHALGHRGHDIGRSGDRRRPIALFEERDDAVEREAGRGFSHLFEDAVEAIRVCLREVLGQIADQIEKRGGLRFDAAGRGRRFQLLQQLLEALRLTDDPACKEPGWRTTLQVIAPWIRVTTPELRVDDIPMIARVKWNEKRVCLEGLEVKLPDVNVRVPNTGGNEPMKIGSWLVMRGTTFARVAIAEGVEWRQSIECSIVPPPAKP